MDAPAGKVVPEAYPRDALSSATFPNAGPTPLQGHTAFFDTDGDGIIWPRDTWRGFRILGYNLLICLFSVIAIHGAFSYLTWGSLLPDPFFRLKIKNMHKAIHGSDSHTYSRRGLWNDFNFDEMFRMYGDPPYDSLTFRQTIRLYRGNFDPFDPFGWVANGLEWLATYLLLWPEDGRMMKEDIKGVFNGTIFYRIAEENKQKEVAKIEAAEEQKRLALERAAERKRIAQAQAEERQRAATVKAEEQRAAKELAWAEKRQSEAATHAIRAVEAHGDAVAHAKRSDIAAANAKKLA